MTINPPTIEKITESEPPSPFAIPKKYPGVLLPIQKKYLNPNLCCMCGQPNPTKTIAVTQEYTEFNWGKVTHKLTMSFPICQECHRMHNRLKLATTAGYVVGLLVGGGLAAVIYEVTGKPKNAWWWIILLVLIGMVVFNVVGASLVLKHVPKEKHAFYGQIGENKGIRMVFNVNEGFVAIGFLSRDFATAFQLSNGGLPTEV
jgi:hypothetical protein